MKAPDIIYVEQRTDGLSDYWFEDTREEKDIRNIAYIRKDLVDIMRSDDSVSSNDLDEEALGPKCKESLHIPETCKENGDSFTFIVDGECIDNFTAGCVIDTEYGCLNLPPETFKIDDRVKIYIFKDEE